MEQNMQNRRSNGLMTRSTRILFFPSSLVEPFFRLISDNSTCYFLIQQFLANF